LDSDRKNNADTISAKQLSFMEKRTTDPTDPVVTVFDYCSYHRVPEITVCCISDPLVAPAFQAAGAEWETLLSRVRRSAGRMHLHVMRIPGDDIGLNIHKLGEMRYLVVPLRTPIGHTNSAESA
jgi:hypothetical protein